mmetsp:Transcript_11634/g.37267  ORF Transcript_11634/g.37267 Transcript_11634/m.37267 type:complete len:258 (-) Transcript_11634:19-792(-)
MGLERLTFTPSNHDTQPGFAFSESTIIGPLRVHPCHRRAVLTTLCRRPHAAARRTSALRSTAPCVALGHLVVERPHLLVERSLRHGRRASGGTARERVEAHRRRRDLEARRRGARRPSAWPARELAKQGAFDHHHLAGDELLCNERERATGAHAPPHSRRWPLVAESLPLGEARHGRAEPEVAGWPPQWRQALCRGFGCLCGGGDSAVSAGVCLIHALEARRRLHAPIDDELVVGARPRSRPQPTSSGEASRHTSPH